MPDVSALARMLRVNGFFASLPAEMIATIAELGVLCRLDEGETLFMKGDPGDALYAVLKGQIRISTSNEEGRHYTLNLLGAGDVFGEIALLDGQPRTADATAAEAAELFMVRRRDFLDLLARRPDASGQIIAQLCSRLRYIIEQMEEVVLLPIGVRLARRLLALTDDFGAELNVSQEVLAAFVGSTRESVNRQLRQWQAAGLVRLGRSRILVLDRDRLSCAHEPA